MDEMDFIPQNEFSSYLSHFWRELQEGLDPDADTEAELVQGIDIYSVQKNTRLTGCPDRQRSKPEYKPQDRQTNPIRRG